MDKGAINWGHVLLLPIEHHRCGLALQPGTHGEMMRILSALRSCYAAQVRFLYPEESVKTPGHYFVVPSSPKRHSAT